MNTPKPMTVEEATRAIYDATNNMRWTSVKDKLPDYDVPVLWCLESGVMFIEDIGHDDDWENFSNTRTRCPFDPDGVYRDPITHWMPLPPAPTSDPNQ